LSDRLFIETKMSDFPSAAAARPTPQHADCGRKTPNRGRGVPLAPARATSAIPLVANLPEVQTCA
jgi:hypothetical protein